MKTNSRTAPLLLLSTYDGQYLPGHRSENLHPQPPWRALGTNQCQTCELLSVSFAPQLQKSRLATPSVALYMGWFPLAPRTLSCPPKERYKIHRRCPASIRVFLPVSRPENSLSTIEITIPFLLLQSQPTRAVYVSSAFFWNMTERLDSDL